jgi:hypothetical protein
MRGTEMDSGMLSSAGNCDADDDADDDDDDDADDDDDDDISCRK